MKKQQAMPVNDFEKQVQQKMDELKFAPSAEVWTEVEKRIRKEKKRRRIIFWWLIPGLLMGGAAIYFLSNKGEGKTIAKQEQVQPKQKEENGNVNQPSTNVSTTDNTVQTETTLPAEITDKKKVADVLAKKDQPGYNQNANADVSVSKVATKKKTKVKESITTNELATVENQQVLVTNAATMKKEQEQAVAKTEMSEPISEKTAANKEVAVETKDSIMVAAKEETKIVEEQKTAIEESLTTATKKSKKKWDIGFGVQAGSSNTLMGNLFGGAMESFNASPLNNAGNGGIYTGPPIYLEAPKKGLSVGIDFFVQKSISKKLALRAAVEYDYLSTHIKTGSRVDSSRSVNNSISDGLTISNFYRPPGGSADRSYTNRYHLLGISATVSWKIIGGKKFNVSWDNGIAVSQLISTNALHYDRNLRAYYNDFEPFRKAQFFLGTGLSVPLIKKEKFSMLLNPFAQFGLGTVLKKSDGQDSRFVNAGFALKFLFPHKN